MEEFPIRVRFCEVWVLMDFTVSSVLCGCMTVVTEAGGTPGLHH